MADLAVLAAASSYASAAALRVATRALLSLAIATCFAVSPCTSLTCHEHAAWTKAAAHFSKPADPGFTAYRNEMSLTPLMLAVRSSSQDALRERSPDLVNLLIEHGANPYQTGPGGCTALHIACDMPRSRRKFTAAMV